MVQKVIFRIRDFFSQAIPNTNAFQRNKTLTSRIDTILLSHIMVLWNIWNESSLGKIMGTYSGQCFSEFTVSSVLSGGTNRSLGIKDVWTPF